MTEPLHPAPDEYGPKDHRDRYNRQQLNDGHHGTLLWRRVVEKLAEELQIEPIEAHFMLDDAYWEVDKGRAWDWWS